MKRATLGLLMALSFLLPVSLATPAAAHTELVESTPQDGQQLDAPPTEIVLRFSEELLADTVTVTLTDSSGALFRVAPMLDETTLTAPWPDGLAGDAYTINYRVVSLDGHPVTGSVAFSYPGDTSPAPSLPAAATAGATPEAEADTPEGSSNSNAGVWVAVGIVLIGVAAGGYVIRRRT